MRRLLAVPNRRYKTGVRNRALLRLFWCSGLRCSEALNLTLRDFDFDKTEIRVNRGKGAKDRIVYTDRATAEIVRGWCDVKPRSNWIFCTLRGAQLKDAYVREMLARYGKKAGIAIRVHPHLLRHTYASEFLEVPGNTMIELQQQLGHEDLETTAIYSHVSNANLRRRMSAWEK